MYSNELRSKIEIDQRRQLNGLVFVLIVVLFSVVTSAVAPQLLYEYLLQDVSADQQLVILQYIPVVAYVVSFVAFVLSAIGFVNHGRRTRMYEQEMMLLEYGEDGCNCADCDCDHDEDASDEDTMVQPVSSSVADLSAAMSQTNGARKKSVTATKKKSKK